MRRKDELRHYQRRLARRLIRDFGEYPGALLAVEMSLGKTATTLTVMRRLLDSTQIRRWLIVAPLRVAQKTWPDEIAEWQHLAPLKYKSLCGKIGENVTAAKRKAWLREFLQDPSMEIAIINRENLPWLYKALRGRPWPFDGLVYDESSRLKEGKKRTAGRAVSEFGVLAATRKFYEFVIELTGTPTPNGLIDLWGQMYIIDQGERLGTTKQAFLDRWFTSDYKGWNWTPKPHAEEEIMDLISDVMVSLKTRDMIDLPPVVRANHYVDLTPKEMKEYRRLVRELALEEYDIEAANKGVLTGKLLQYANGSVYRNLEADGSSRPKREEVAFHNHKIAALESIVAETAGANLLVAYSFKFDLARIKKRFKYAREATEPGALDAWNRGEVRMLLAHPASIGHGMNLQFGGHHTVWFGLNGSLELYQQLNARLARPGQKAKTVFIHHILARATFDERLAEVLADKDATQERITEAVKWQVKAAKA